MFMQRALLMAALFSGSLLSMDTRSTRSLFWPLKKDRTDEVKYFLSGGMDVNIRFSYMDSGRVYLFKGVTPLMVAAIYGSVKTVDFLLRQPNISINARDKQSGDTALIMAARCGQHRTVRQLLDAGANPFLKNKKQWTALKEAKRSLLRQYALGYDESFKRIIDDLIMACQKST